MKTIKEIVADYISTLSKSDYTDMMFFANVLFNNINYGNCTFDDVRTKSGFSQLLDILKDVNETITEYQKHNNISPYFLYTSKNNVLCYYSTSKVLEIIETNKLILAEIMSKDVERYSKFWLRFGNNLKSIL